MGNPAKQILTEHPRKQLPVKGLLLFASSPEAAQWMIASPALAYMAVITTSVAVASGADEAEVRAAVESAVTDVLRRAIAFSPTIVTLEIPCALSSPKTMPSSGTA